MRKKLKMVLIGVVILSILTFIIGLFSLTGRIADNEPFEYSIGPSQEEQNCMFNCVSQECESGNRSCMEKNSEKCLAQCGVQKPEVTEETGCMENCVVKGCDQYDFTCQGKNQAVCEKECGMIKEPEAKNEEEQCIRDCVNKISSGLICQSSQTGETGNEVCKKCADECVYLYAGPCLNDKELKAKQKYCEICEHCYGEPLMGDSGEGWECIVDVECKDASSEFGDQPGVGEGIVTTVKNTVGGIVDFFKGIFGVGKENSENNEIPEEFGSENSPPANEESSGGEGIVQG